MKTHLGLLFMLILSIAGVLLLGGCQSGGASEPAPATAVQPAAPVEQPKPVPGGRCGPCMASQTYPAGDVIRLDLQTPNQVPLNAPFDYTIKVTNLTDVTASDVVITERLPKNFKFQKSDPPAKTDDTSLVWTLDSLDPEASREIKVSGMATTADCLKHCATVTFLVPACANIEVVEPKLMLTKTAPKEATPCDPIPVRIVVANNGSGAIQGVKIVDTLPTGLTTADGKSEVVFDAGTLAAGQSKPFSIMLKAAKAGEYVNKVVASSSGGLKAEATTTTVIHQPALAITKSGPEKQYAGRPVTYEITVTSKGDAPAVNTIVEDTLPQGVQAIQASSGGTVSGSKVVWQLGTLAPNASRKMTVTCTPRTAQTLANTATAVAECAEAVTASAKTTIVGIAAVLLEVVDDPDPVEIGSQTTYTITTTNQGSIASTNVQITCTLEEAEQYVSSSGDTTAKVEGNTITFAPLPSLAAKAKATWRVVVKAVKPGDIRFRATMRTAELGRPVEETEATQLY